MPTSTDCEHGVWVGACNACKPIHTSRDQLWHFDYPFKAGQPKVAIHSKRQFDVECRARGLRHVSRDDLLSKGQPSRPQPKTMNRQVLEPVLKQVIQESKSKDRVETAWKRQQRRRGGTP